MRSLKADFNLDSNRAPKDSRRTLIELAYTIAEWLDGHFHPSRNATATHLSQTSHEDEFDGYFSSKTTSRLGNEEQGFIVEDTLGSSSDGVAPGSQGINITAYGLLPGRTLTLSASFISPAYHKPSPVSIHMTGDETTLQRIMEMLERDFGAVSAADSP